MNQIPFEDTNPFIIHPPPLSSRLLLPEPNDQVYSTQLYIIPISSRIIPKMTYPTTQRYINNVSWLQHPNIWLQGPNIWSQHPNNRSQGPNIWSQHPNNRSQEVPPYDTIIPAINPIRTKTPKLLNQDILYKRRCRTTGELRIKSHVRSTKTERDIEQLLDLTTDNIPVPNAHILPFSDEDFALESENFSSADEILSCSKK